MSTTLPNFLIKLNNLIGDNIVGTTDAAGNADGTTFVDSALSKYEDNYFGDPEKNTEWWAYIGTALRTIKKSLSSGTISVHKAFSSPIGANTTYQIHKFDRNKKILACNQALNQAYPVYYNRLEDSSSLDGKGPGDNEYSVPATFTYFPAQIWEKRVSGTQITYIPIIEYTARGSSGAFKFYANITTGNDIVLIGKKELTAFTNDASTTELLDAQADIVVLLAGTILYRNISADVNATSSERFDSLANRYEIMWNERKYRCAMPLLAIPDINYGWLNE